MGLLLLFSLFGIANIKYVYRHLYIHAEKCINYWIGSNLVHEKLEGDFSSFFLVLLSHYFVFLFISFKQYFQIWSTLFPNSLKYPSKVQPSYYFYYIQFIICILPILNRIWMTRIRSFIWCTRLRDHGLLSGPHTALV